MQIELARYITRSAFRSVAELQNVLPLLQDHASRAEYETYRQAIAKAIGTIGDEITNRVLADNPGLSAEIESSIATYGRLM